MQSSSRACLPIGIRLIMFKGRPVVTSGWQRATGTLRGPRAYRRSFLPLKGLSSSPHFVHLALMAWKSQGRSWRKSRKIVWKASLKFPSDRADPDRLFHALERSHPLPGPGPGQHSKQTSRLILRQSVLDRVCCARQIRDPSHQSSLNPSSYRRLFPSKIRPLPLEPTIWNISTPKTSPVFHFDPAEKKLCFASAFRLGTNHKQSPGTGHDQFFKAKTDPQRRRPPSPSSSSQYFPLVLPYPPFYPQPGIPQNSAAGSTQSTPKHGLRLGLLRASPAPLAANCRTHVAVNLR